MPIIPLGIEEGNFQKEMIKWKLKVYVSTAIEYLRKNEKADL